MNLYYNLSDSEIENLLNEHFEVLKKQVFMIDNHIFRASSQSFFGFPGAVSIAIHITFDSTTTNRSIELSTGLFKRCIEEGEEGEGKKYYDRTIIDKLYSITEFKVKDITDIVNYYRALRVIYL